MRAYSAVICGQTIEHHLDPLEREILCRMDGLTTFRDLDINQEQVVKAIRSLLRRRLLDSA